MCGEVCAQVQYDENGVQRTKPPPGFHVFECAENQVVRVASGNAMKERSMNGVQEVASSNLAGPTI